MHLESRNNAVDRLSLQIQGNIGETNLPFVTDEQGRFILSPTLSTDIVAENLSIRDLTPTRDNLEIGATDLDIRNLSGTRDSVMIYGRDFAEGVESGTIVALGARNFLPRDISVYGSNHYEVINTGGVGVTVTVQIAPVDNDNYYVNDGSSFSLIAGGTQIFTPSRLMKFSRIRVTAVLLGSVTVSYFGQT